MHDHDGRWWLHDDAALAARACYAAATRLAERDSHRAARLRLYRALYTDRSDDELGGVDPQPLATQGGDPSVEGLAERSTAARKNAVASAVDTMHSRLIKHQPRPWIVTTGADWDSYSRARAASQWLDGYFAAAAIYPIGDAVTQDMLIEGTGCAQVWDDDDLPLPQVELVRASELHVDPIEEQTGKIRTLYRVRNIDREVLLERFGAGDDDESATIRDRLESLGTHDIDAAAIGIDESQGYAKVLAVAESWRLPARPYFDAWGRRHGRAKGGRHVLCVGETMLLDEEWCDDDFPFVFQRFRRDSSSFWSIGLAEQLAMVQLDSNDLEATLCDSFAQMVPCWLVPEGSTPPEKISDARRSIYTYSPAGPPQFYAPSPVSPELLMRSQQQIDSAFQLAGVSQLSAAMLKPAGLDSGIALQNYQDIESERHIGAARSREAFFCDLGRKVLRCADRIAERMKAREGDEGGATSADLMAVYGGRRTLRAVQYTSASLRDTPHEVRIFPVSSLAQTPAARLQQVNDMWNMGLIEDRASMLELLSMPDLDRYSERELSGRWEVDELVDMAIDGSPIDELEVHSYMDHPYLRKRAQQTRSMARRRKAPASVLDSLDHLISMADMYLQKAAAAAATEAPPGAPLPPGMAAPTMAA